MNNSNRRVGIVVLGAGSSRRMGTPKQLIEVEGEAMIRRAAKVALRTTAHLVFVTVPSESPEITAAMEGIAVRIVPVVHPELGQSESIREGLAEVEREDCEAVLFMPCDLPLLEDSHLQALIDVYLNNDFQAVASRYGGIMGIPLILDHSTWDDLKSLSGDTGARKILPNYMKRTSFIDWQGGKFDIDTPQDAQLYFESRS